MTFEELLENAVQELFIAQGTPEAEARETMTMAIAKRAGESMAWALASKIEEKVLATLDLDAIAAKAQEQLEGRIETAVLNRLATSDWMQAKVIEVAAAVAADKVSGDEALTILREKAQQDSQEIAEGAAEVRKVLRLSPMLRLNRVEQSLARVELIALAEGTRLGLPAPTDVVEFLLEKGRAITLREQIAAGSPPEAVRGLLEAHPTAPEIEALMAGTATAPVNDDGNPGNA